MSISVHSKITRLALFSALATLVTVPLLAGARTGGLAAKASRGFPATVSFVPQQAGGVGVVADLPDSVVMGQVDKAFDPKVLIARVGQNVVFKNGEALVHNVHLYDMSSDETLLNVAQPMMGMSTEYVFDKVGAYAVLCDMHTEMEAYVVVVDTPYATVAAKDGAFSLDLPEGDYTMNIWSVDEKKQRTERVHVDSSGLQLGTR